MGAVAVLVGIVAVLTVMVWLVDPREPPAVHS